MMCVGEKMCQPTLTRPRNATIVVLIPCILRTKRRKADDAKVKISLQVDGRYVDGLIFFLSLCQCTNLNIVIGSGFGCYRNLVFLYLSFVVPFLLLEKQLKRINP
ncbi:hypothetical protein HS088_TW19G00469 [Tripterygium wilfordii]|uniref:Uncharacterized protein n=1 Tax=Tripterygium wilfordii TaxID=458696 RepID=A0A7J7CAH4_TRIWF|nr:hypothetical protein HS088_TW19G00469 [Tripterygium wilfordii]